jgi:DNA topoisomerase-1
MKNLLIVESPAKAKTIEKYLGKDYVVMASFGHIRDLPSKDGSVEPDKDFAMHYEISAKSNKHVKEIVEKAKFCEKLILAPDPDREGESIAWHVLEILKQKKAIKSSTKVERVVFNAITKNSVLEAIKQPREIDMDLVNAQQARRALDYLVGFTLSPILWRKLPGSRSAGRVQSVALRLICDREEEIENFKSEEYWDIKVNLKNNAKESFFASLVEVEGKKLEKFSIQNQIEAEKISKILESKQYQVVKITKKQSKRKPNAPFTTSSLQQEAARKLGFSAKKTMMIAQKLYEGFTVAGVSQGLITYMRTDSVEISPEGIAGARNSIVENYGKNYLSPEINSFKSKVKNAQEAHEGIRPTDFSLTPAKLTKYIDEDHLALYDLIWKRMLASQMADVVFDQVVADIETLPNYAKCRAVGSVIKFDGFYKIYHEDLDDDKQDEETKKLPELSEEEKLVLLNIQPNQHFTEPLPRYSEASLVKKLEELGIGRPSTYASIISVLQDRGYVKLEKKRFFPEERGRIVTTFLKEFFKKYVEYDYTANLEDELDIVSNGKMDWKKFLSKFWKDFNGNIKDVEKKPFGEVLEILNQKIANHIFPRDESGKIDNNCPSCKKGNLGLRLGKFGAFIGCSNYPDCKNTMQIFDKADGDNSQEKQIEQKERFEPRTLGNDPKTGFEIIVKIGPYGPYLELVGSEIKVAEDKKIKKPTKATKTSKAKKEKTPKPKRISIPKNLDPNLIDLKTAQNLLSLPREVGIHPETGEKIVANVGPYGPYLLHNKKFTSVKEDNILEIGLNRAVDLIADSEKIKQSSKTKGRSKNSFSKKK